jgi:hypothetical protein
VDGMKALTILAAITLTGCLHEGPEATLYCNDVFIATADKGFAVRDGYYLYNIDGQFYRYTAIPGSVCKIVETDLIDLRWVE